LHKRRAHPDLRNEELLAPPPRGEQRPNNLRSPIWSTDEISILEQYGKLYAGDLHINLPYKTNKQVSNYRMERRKKSKRAAADGQQGLDPDDGEENVPASGQSSPLLIEGSGAAGGGDVGAASESLEPQFIGGTEPAVRVPLFSEGESSPLVGGPEPCFNLDFLPGSGQSSPVLL
jgi:hypothetical protein